jgi:phage terminase large subunit-like protein
VPSGVGQGKLLVLREWQRVEIRKIFDPVNKNGTRKIRRALLSMARKNGKSALAAALLLCALVGPLAQVNGEVYSAATTKEQAAMVYKMASQMVKLDPELNALCNCLDTTKRIVCLHLGSFYQALAAEAGSTHGQNPHFVIYDELAQAKNRDLYDVLNTSFGAQENALMLTISTQSSDSQSVMSELVDDALAIAEGMLDDETFYGKVWAADNDDDPWSTETWRKANPALGDFRVLADFEALAAKARRSPSGEASFKNLYLNMRIDGDQAFVSSGDWKACDAFVTDEELEGRPAYGGLDLSGRRDLTALVLNIPLDDGSVAVRSFFWTPQFEIEDREKRDGAHYQAWAKQGHLFILPGKSIDYARVARDIGEITARYNVAHLSFDRYRIEDLKRELDNEGLKLAEDADEAGLYLAPHGQGFKDMAPAIDDLEELIIEHNIKHGGNPLLTYCMGNVRLIRDPADNRKFDKRQQNKRIDGAVALAMAVTSLNRHHETTEKPLSVYEQRGIRAL